jgi:riboflavin transporter FmnP
MKTHEITAAAALAAISAALQLVHVGWASPWGMWIDLVAVSWIVAYFLYGGRTALVVSIVGALIITFAAPSTWLGASLKLIATLPMFMVPVAMQRAMRLQVRDFRKPVLLAMAIAVAIIIRVLIVTPVNYYFAIPIWTGWTPAEAMTFVPWWAIVIMNAAQGVIEVILAWLLVFRFRLDRFSAWK